MEKKCLGVSMDGKTKGVIEVSYYVQIFVHPWSKRDVRRGEE